MFTKLGEKSLELQLSRIVGYLKTISASDPLLNKCNIYLVGGYGRGEGGSGFDKNGCYCIRNNIDVLIVAKNRFIAAKARTVFSSQTQISSVLKGVEISASGMSHNQLLKPGQFNHDALALSYPIHNGLITTGKPSKTLNRPLKEQAIITLRNRSVLLLFAKLPDISHERKLTLYSKFFHGVLDAICIHNGTYETSISRKEAQLSGDSLKRYFPNETAFRWFRRSVRHASFFRFLSANSESLEKSIIEVPEKLRHCINVIYEIDVDHIREDNILKIVKAAHQPTAKARFIQSLRSINKSLKNRSIKTTSNKHLSRQIIKSVYFSIPSEGDISRICREFKDSIE